MTEQVVILAAGLGTRLGRPHPKPLTYLDDGRTILQQQVDNLKFAFGPNLRLTIVVGYKHDLIMGHVPEVSFVYNEHYDQTNTSKSLHKALTNTTTGGVLWMNGDVVFDPRLLELVKPHMAADQSVVSVNVASVADEEIKYTIDSQGFIKSLSKNVPASLALGEAVGINYIASKDKEKLTRRLTEVDNQEYYERAIELTVLNHEVQYLPVDTSRYLAIEVDSEDDLARANEAMSSNTADTLVKP